MKPVKFSPCRVAVVALTALSVTGSAAAQSGDWDLHRDQRNGSLVAYTAFSNDLAIAFRCIDGSLGALVSGLPPSSAERQTLQLKFRDGEAYDSGWTTTTNPTAAVSDFPAPLAREFRQGGDLRLTIPGGAADGRNLQFAVELPPSSAAIDEVLTACNRPLVDPRDAELAAIGDGGLTTGVTWLRLPQPGYPTRSRYAEGFVVTSCLTNPDGSLRDCEIEMEHPQDGHFGEETLRAIRRARVNIAATQGAPAATTRISFRTVYRLR